MLSEDECGGVVAVICRYTYSELISMQFSHSAVIGSPRKRGRLTHIFISCKILHVFRVVFLFFVSKTSPISSKRLFYQKKFTTSAGRLY